MFNLTTRAHLDTALIYGSGNSTRNGTPFDVRDYDGAAMIFTVHDRTASGTLKLKVQGGNAADLSDALDLKDVEFDVPADASLYDGMPVVFDIGKPQQRYIRAVAVKDGTNNTAESCTVALYRRRSEPVPVAAVSEVQFHHAPAVVPA